MTGISFIVEGNPVGQNAAYRRGRGRRLYMTDEAKLWKEKVYWSAIQAIASTKWNKEGSKGVQLLYFFDSRRPDIDGPSKLLLDALQGATYINDRQVTDKIERKRLDKLRPRVEITVWNMEDLYVDGRTQE